MNIPRKFTAIATAAAVAVTALGPLTTSASAEGWRDGRRGGPEVTYVRGEKRNWKRGKRHARKHRRWDDRRHYRRHKRDNTGKYIALGVGALMLGIIASEASRR